MQNSLKDFYQKKTQGCIYHCHGKISDAFGDFDSENGS